MAKSLLQDELRKERPFDHIEQEVALNLHRTSDAIELRFARMFKSFGLTGQQYNVLRILRGVGGEGLPSQAIGERMITFDPDVTRLVDRLLKSDLVERERSKTDRRVVQVKITPKGLSLIKQIDQPLSDLHQTVMAGLDASELQQLNGLLEKVRRSLPRE